MPVVKSTYKAPAPFKNAHFNTIFAAKIRTVTGLSYERERINLQDGDFLDIDWSFSQGESKAKQVVLLFHGLEGHAKRPYMAGTTKILNAHGFDCAAVNLRGCSGETNLHLRSYHSGATDDVADVVAFVESAKDYDQIFLCGFSLGGNLVLKYLGENRSRPESIRAGVAVSTPVDLYDSLEALQQKQNWVYRWSFLKGLRDKYRQKLERYPEELSKQDYKNIKSLRLFDELYTAPANGFKDAMDYYTQSSSKQFLEDIKVPTLILNAKDDSFLNASCYPVEAAQNNSQLFLEMPKTGGHVGFMLFERHTYCEKRSLQFIQEHT
ncbi:MAG: alpha/beta hydrolase [Leeuwenhoekiella sp.]|nr:MAG: alpha/beta hydrolase [Leeuwenhoekiella sp.]